MISLANGGASILAPIRRGGGRDSISETNWDGVFRVYNCLCFLMLIVVSITFTINTLVGYISLREICSKVSIDDAQVIWVAFFIIRFGEFILNLGAAPQVALRGLNHVALMNRWGVIFQLLSVLGGYVTLLTGGGIIHLAIVMQGIALLGVVRNYWLTYIVNEGRLWENWKLSWDQQIFLWAREPLWKGFVSEISKTGVLQLTGIIFTFYASTAGLASYLFSLSIARTIQNFAMAPFSSQMPRFSKMMAQQKFNDLTKVFRQRVILCQIMLILGFGMIAIMGPYVLAFIGSNTELLPTMQWLVLGCIFLYERFNTYCLAMCAAGNNIQLYWSQAFVGLCSVALMFYLIPYLGVWGILLSLAVPSIFLMNIRPFYKMKKQLSPC